MTGSFSDSESEMISPGVSSPRDIMGPVPQPIQQRGKSFSKVVQTRSSLPISLVEDRRLSVKLTHEVSNEIIKQHRLTLVPNQKSSNARELLPIPLEKAKKEVVDSRKNLIKIDKYHETLTNKLDRRKTDRMVYEKELNKMNKKVKDEVSKQQEMEKDYYQLRHE